MPTDPISYRAGVAEALMRDHGRSWHDAFEIAEAISAMYIAEGIGPKLAALRWIEYITLPPDWHHTFEDALTLRTSPG